MIHKICPFTRVWSTCGWVQTQGAEESETARHENRAEGHYTRGRGKGANPQVVSAHNQSGQVKDDAQAATQDQSCGIYQSQLLPN